MNPVKARSNDVVYEAAGAMSNKNICSVICADRREVLGAVMESDMVRRVLVEDRNSKMVKVSSVMYAPVLSISSKEYIVDAAQLGGSGMRRIAMIRFR